MKRWLALLIGAACIVAALVMLPRLWRSEPSALDMARQPGAAGSGARPGLGGGAADRPGRQSLDGRAEPRARGPSSFTGGAGARGGDGNDDGRGEFGGDGSDPAARGGAGRDVPLAADHAVPAAAGRPEPADGESADAEAIPEVAYESGPDQVFDTGAQAELTDAGPISGEAGTVAFWLKPDWGPQSQDDASFVQFGDSGLQVTKNVNFLRFEYIDPRTGQEYGVGTNIGDWQAGDWRHVTATWTGTSLALYVDGKLVSENRFPNPPDFQNETKVYVGSSFPSGAPVALGHMMQMTLLNRGTSGAEVTRWYNAGAPHR